MAVERTQELALGFAHEPEAHLLAEDAVFYQILVFTRLLRPDSGSAQAKTGSRKSGRSTGFGMTHAELRIVDAPLGESLHRQNRRAEQGGAIGIRRLPGERSVR